MWRDLDHEPLSNDRDHTDASRGGPTDLDPSDRGSRDPRDVFARDLDLPRGVSANVSISMRGPTNCMAPKCGCRPRVRFAWCRKPTSETEPTDVSDLRHLQDLDLIRTVPSSSGKTRTP